MTILQMTVRFTALEIIDYSLIDDDQYKLYLSTTFIFDFQEKKFPVITKSGFNMGDVLATGTTLQAQVIDARLIIVQMQGSSMVVGYGDGGFNVDCLLLCRDV